MSDPLLDEVRWDGTTLRLRGTLPGPATDAGLVLRERDGDRVHELPAEVRDAGFAAAVAADALPRGLWDVSLRTGSATAPLAYHPGLDSMPRRRFLPDSTMVIAYFALRGGGLALDVGGAPHPAGSTTADALAWNADDEELVVRGHLAVPAAETPVSATLVLHERGGATYEVIAMLEAGPDRLDYTAAVPLTRAFVDDPLPRGTWAAHLVLGFAGMHRDLLVFAPADPVELHVRRRLVPVRVSTARAPEPLTISVGR
ncbi:hypothetical protein [Actinomadura kijaniata]|uniref:hypothetical protein n=1 Tax=Actinomadura kijaniata TaxID=46161 RepID=UPI00082C0BDE|nr:hypothetical protein [Actinomadura kijaniata]